MRSRRALLALLVVAAGITMLAPMQCTGARDPGGTDRTRATQPRPSGQQRTRARVAPAGKQDERIDAAKAGDKPSPAPPTEPAASIEPAGTRVRILVVDSEGEPVPRAHVRVVDVEEAATPLETAPLATGPVDSSVEDVVVLTDAAGEAVLPIEEDDDWFRVHAKRHGAVGASEALFPVEGGERRVTVRLEPALTVSGTVVDDDGRAMPNAVVTMLASNPGARRVRRVTRSDGHGEFRFTRVPPSQLRQGAEFTAFAGHGTTVMRTAADRQRLQSGPIELRVAAAVRVTGRCLDSDGRPVAGVRVATTGNNIVVTGDDGTFEHPFAPETLTHVTMHHARLATHRVALVRAAADELTTGDVELSAGTDVRVRIATEPGVPLRTTIVAALLPGSDVPVRMTLVRPPSEHCVLRALGSESLRIRAWSQTRGGASDATGHLPLAGHVENVTPSAEEVVVRLRPGLCVVLSFVDAVSRAPVEGGRMLVSLTAATPERASTVASHVAGTRLTLKHEPPGRYDIGIDSTAFHPVSLDGVDVAVDSVTRVEVPLRRR